MNPLLIVQIVVCLILIGLILLQANGATFGRTLGSLNTNYHTRKGAEKMVFYGTILFSALFVISSLLNLVLSR